MPPGHQQHQVGIGGSIGHPGGKRVTDKVIDADQRKAGRNAETLGAHDTGQNTADQPGTGCNGYGVEVIKAEAGLPHCFANGDIQLFGVRAGGDFGDDPAKGRVKVGLTIDHGGEDVGSAFGGVAHDGGGRVVTAAFQSENGEVLRHAAGSVA